MHACIPERLGDLSGVQFEKHYGSFPIYRAAALGLAEKSHNYGGYRFGVRL